MVQFSDDCLPVCTKIPCSIRKTLERKGRDVFYHSVEYVDDIVMLFVVNSFGIKFSIDIGSFGMSRNLGTSVGLCFGFLVCLYVISM